MSQVRLICASHTPMMEFIHPAPEVESAARGAFAELAREVAEFDPQLVVIFAPDHFNGFFYDLMPPFCLGVRARGAGDWDYWAGDLKVPEALALELVRAVQGEGVDLAYSYRMQTDHGFTQPLALLTEEVTRYPVLPIFINCAAQPLPPARRALALGAAVGRFLAGRDERVLIIGSGGLSHDPPTPQMGQVPPEVEEFLIAGRNPTPEARARRQANVVAKGRALADGEGQGETLPLDAAWDEGLIADFLAARLERFDTMSDAEISARGGRGGHEIRAWIAAFAALRALGPYRASRHFYHPIDEWIAGMGVVSAQAEPAETTPR